MSTSIAHVREMILLADVARELLLWAGLVQVKMASARSMGPPILAAERLVVAVVVVANSGCVLAFASGAVSR